VFDGFNNVFWILEYAKQDKIGRLHSWNYGGTARSEAEVESMTADLKNRFACEVRSHRYSHAMGKNA
jgi:hypothetical protein